MARFVDFSTHGLTEWFIESPPAGRVLHMFVAEIPMF